MIGKWSRNYRLDIFTPSNEQITIELPFTLQLNIQRDVGSSANKGTFTIFNLGEATRNKIYKDRFTITEYWRVRLWAGYGNRLHEGFTGNALEAYSYKNGTDWMTVIDCFDGMDAIQNGFTSMTVQKDTSHLDVFKKVINDMPNVTAGLIGALGDGSAARGKSLIGQSSEILNIETDGQFYIDKETVNILTDEEVISGDVVVLDSDQLLQTPRRRDSFIDLVTLFEPAVQVGQIYEINSLESRFNGQYAIKGFNHSGVISASVNGQMTTNLSVWYDASKGLKEVG